MAEELEELGPFEGSWNTTPQVTACALAHESCSCVYNSLPWHEANLNRDWGTARSGVGAGKEAGLGEGEGAGEMQGRA